MSDTLRPEDAPPDIYDDGGHARFFSDPAMDRFVAVIMNIAQEVWVQEERLRAIEEARGESATDRDTAAKAFIDRVFEPLRGA